MVAKVIQGKTIRGVLSYNENKVQESKALCIYAHNFPAEVDSLSFKAKLDTFYKYISKNDKVRTNAIHISLSFHKQDKLETDALRNIASRYLEKIGFGNQPFLVYQHFDAAHPHLHIITTNVQLNARRIDLHNIGRGPSGKARREIETEFKLINADGRKLSNDFLRPIDLLKAEYGKTETKRSISNIVNTVTRAYKYTSIHELNAVLKQYNITADNGKEGSIVRAKDGLRYCIIDRSGQPIGIPIKASSIYGKPTLSFLRDKFEVNQILRSPHKERLKGLIDHEISRGKESFSKFIENLIKQNVYPVVRQNANGQIYGITFVDNQTKCVFNGSDLGKRYTAKGLMDRLKEVPENGSIEIPTFTSQATATRPEFNLPSIMADQEVKPTGILAELTGAHLDKADVDWNLKKKRRRRKRKMI